MMCQRIGFSPICTSGLGTLSVSSRRRVPMPPHRITTGMSSSGVRVIASVAAGTSGHCWLAPAEIRVEAAFVKELLDAEDALEAGAHELLVREPAFREGLVKLLHPARHGPGRFECRQDPLDLLEADAVAALVGP